AVQAHADVETLGGRSPTSLFLLSVARSGERKSACFAPAVAPIQRIEEEEIEGYARRLRRYEDAHAIWEADRKRLIAGSDVIERDVDLEALEEPTAPLCPHRIFEDVTFEGLLRSFADGQPSVAIFADEGAQILGGYAMRSENKAKSDGDVSKLWSGSAQGRACAGSAVPTGKYIGRRVRCHLMVQPRIAEQATGDVEIRDQGFWARCLIAWPETSFGTRLHKTHDRTAPALEAYDRHLEALFRCAPPTAADARILRPRLLSLSPAAKEHLIAYHDAAEREIAPDGRLAEVADFASKSAEQAARIAAVLTLYENPDATLVTPEAMENATGLADWYLFEAERIFGTRAVSPLTKDAEKLLGWILKRNAQTITIHEANHCGPKPLRAVATLDPLFALLERLNWLLPIPSPGRKATWWINRP
ncbi:MAG: YfjI family protein, partial [Pseudomonadota bacterium]